MQKIAGWIVAGVLLFAVVRGQDGGNGPSPLPGPTPVPAPAETISAEATLALQPLQRMKEGDGPFDLPKGYPLKVGSAFLALATYVEAGNCKTAAELRKVNLEAGKLFAARYGLAVRPRPEVGEAVDKALAAEIGDLPGELDAKRRDGAAAVFRAAALALGVKP